MTFFIDCPSTRALSLISNEGDNIIISIALSLFLMFKLCISFKNLRDTFGYIIFEVRSCERIIMLSYLFNTYGTLVAALSNSSLNFMRFDAGIDVRVDFHRLD